MDKKEKKVGRPRAGKELKKSFNVYLEPSVRDEIVDADGSLTAALEHRHKQIKRKKNNP
jgi:hypothetical protein